jgi:hypothetical protein
MFGAATVIDVVVVHPSVDNVVGADVLAVGLGYVMGKVIVGPALNVLTAEEGLPTKTAEAAFFHLYYTSHSI